MIFLKKINRKLPSCNILYDHLIGMGDRFMADKNWHLKNDQDQLSQGQPQS